MVIKGRIPSAVYEAQRDAETIVGSARAEAARARAEAGAVAEEARAAGHAEGLEAARAEATRIIAAAHAEAARVRADAARDLARLAVHVAEKVLAREVAMAPDAVVAVAEQAIALARGGRTLVVRAHPDDVAALDAARVRLLDGVREIELCADAAVARGGCVVESEAGVVDARLEVQLAALERALVGE